MVNILSPQNKKSNITIGYRHNFAEDYLTSLYFLLINARENNNDYSVFTYTLPIITILICFLESNINDFIYSILMSNSEETLAIRNICKDFIKLDKTEMHEKYSIIAKYYRNIDIKSDNKYEKVNLVRKLRNLLIHDKSYEIYPSQGDKDKIIELLKNHIKPNNKLRGMVPVWLPYLEYNSLCWMTKCIFDFYLWYEQIIAPETEPRYQDKINRIKSLHPLIQ